MLALYTIINKKTHTIMDKSVFIEKLVLLKEAYNDKDDQGFDKIWHQFDFDKNPSYESILVHLLLDRVFYLSSFQIENNQSIKEIEDKIIDFQCKIIKHFSLPNQLKIMNFFEVIDRISQKHFDILNISKDNEQQLLDNAHFIFLITHTFNKENFEILDNLVHKFSTPLFEIQSNSFQICYKTQNSNATRYINSKKNKVPFKINSVLNYSEEKMYFLKKYNIKPLTSKEIEKYINTLNKSMEPNGVSYVDDIKDVVIKNVNLYNTFVEMQLLQKNIKNKETSHKFKI